MNVTTTVLVSVLLVFVRGFGLVTANAPPTQPDDAESEVADASAESALSGLRELLAAHDADAADSDVPIGIENCPLVRRESFAQVIASITPSGPLDPVRVVVETADGPEPGDRQVAAGIACTFTANDPDAVVTGASLVAADLGATGGIDPALLVLLDEHPESGPELLGGRLWVGDRPFPDETNSFVALWIDGDLLIALHVDLLASISDANPVDVAEDDVGDAFMLLLPTVLADLASQAGSAAHDSWHLTLE